MFQINSCAMKMNMPFSATRRVCVLNVSLRSYFLKLMCINYLHVRGVAVESCVLQAAAPFLLPGMCERCDARERA